MKEKALSALKIIGLAAAFFTLVYGVSYAMNILPTNFLIPIFDTIAGPILFEPILIGALSMLVVFVSVRILCKTSFYQLGIAFSPGWLKHWGIGIIIGGITILMIWGCIFLFGGYEVQTKPIDSTIITSLFCMLIAKLFVGYYEEALARGAMAYVGRKAGRVFSTAVVAMVFSLLHFLNPGFRMLSFVNTILIAIIFAQLTWISGDLWIAIGYHFIWNTMEAFLGVPVSGIQFDSVILSNSAKSSHLLSGGDYGLEASLPAFIILLIQVTAIGFLWIKQKRVNPNPIATWLTASDEKASPTDQS